METLFFMKHHGLSVFDLMNKNKDKSKLSMSYIVVYAEIVQLIYDKEFINMYFSRHV